MKYKDKTLLQLIEELIWFDKPNRLKEIFSRLLGVTSDLQEQIDNLPSGGGSEVKEAVYYIGGQNETGLTGVIEKTNTTETVFSFIRASVGTFGIINYDKTKHFVEFNCNFERIKFSNEDGSFTTMELASNDPSDFEAFEFGGWIKITEY